jgi:hypothetical protein
MEGIDTSRFKDKNVTIIDMLETLKKGREAYDVYTKNYKLNELYDYLTSLSEIPADRIPQRPNILKRVANTIVDAFRPDTVAKKDFSAIFEQMDDILKIDAGPQGALLQNLVRACLNRISDMENTSPTQDSNKNVEASIVKYVGEVRNLVDSINHHAKAAEDLRETVAKQARMENQVIMDAVKETVLSLFPAKMADFQRVLLSKLTSFKK